jgi:hypothetical protein
VCSFSSCLQLITLLFITIVTGFGFLPKDTALHHQAHILKLVQMALKEAQLQPKVSVTSGVSILLRVSSFFLDLWFSRSLVLSFSVLMSS